MWQIAIKDLKIFISDKKALALTLLLPIGLITLFAFGFGGITKQDNNPDSIIVLFTDNDNSKISQQIITELDSIPGIVMQQVSLEDGATLIKKGDRVAQIIFNPNFQKSLYSNDVMPLEFRYDKSRELEVGFLQSVLLNKLGKLKGSIAAEQGIDNVLQTIYPNMSDAEKQKIKSSLKQNKGEETLLLKMTSVTGDTQANWGLIQAVAGTAIMMLLFSISAIGTSIIEEKENGVLKKLLQSPLYPFEILTGKMISAFIISISQLIIMFVFSWLAFGLPIFSYLPEVIVMILITALACSAFGILLASISSSKRQADALRTIAILFMSAIGGSMIPLFIMPDFMQRIAIISLNYWSIQAFYDIFWRQTGFSGLMENIIVLLGITIGLIIAAFYFFRKNILNIIN